MIILLIGESIILQRIRMVIVGQKRDNLALNLTNKDFFLFIVCVDRWYGNLANKPYFAVYKVIWPDQNLGSFVFYGNPVVSREQWTLTSLHASWVDILKSYIC